MDLIIPMAGFGERFRRAGHDVPKPLIEVHGRAMVQHVVERFPGARRVILVASEEHLGDARVGMRERLQVAIPQAEIIAVPAHRRGPVHTLALARGAIDPESPIAVAMCDLNFPWDFHHFQSWVGGADGAVVCYRGFHPHLLRSVHYAFVEADGLHLRNIQEKGAFTSDPIRNGEWCSNGVYWLRSGALLLEYVAKVLDSPQLAIAGEHYVSQLFQPMVREGLEVVVYPTRHYLQWGNPEDLRDYEHHARGFARRAVPRRPLRLPGTLLVPMAGLGQRFADQGYPVPKPLIEVGGRPMGVAAALELPTMERVVFVQRADLPGLEMIQAELRGTFPGCAQVVLPGPTDGQARTCLLGLQQAAVDPEAPVVVGTCDNGLSFDDEVHAAALGGADLLVWVMRGHPGAMARPEQFGWIEAQDGRVRRVSVKVPLADPSTDPAIVGVFSFRRARHLSEIVQRLIDRDGRVRGELYLDAAIEDALALGLDVQTFEIDHYHGWGTPAELETWRYWQSFFHAWPEHPYRLERDGSVRSERVAELGRQDVPPPPWRGEDG